MTAGVIIHQSRAISAIYYYTVLVVVKPMKFVKILTNRGTGACPGKRSRKVSEVWQGCAATIAPDSVACEAAGSCQTQQTARRSGGSGRQWVRGMAYSPQHGCHWLERRGRLAKLRCGIVNIWGMVGC